MYKDLDIYSKLFKEYKQYISEKSQFAPRILKKTPQSLTYFPTILMKETVNNTNTHTLNGQEFTDRLAYTIEIYTKDSVVGNTKYASDIVMRDLQYLTFEFFNNMKFKRDVCNNAEYIDINVDRKVMIFSCKINSWNGKII